MTIYLSSNLAREKNTVQKCIPVPVPQRGAAIFGRKKQAARSSSVIMYIKYYERVLNNIYFLQFKMKNLSDKEVNGS